MHDCLEQLSPGVAQALQFSEYTAVDDKCTEEGNAAPINTKEDDKIVF
jgi:hypothetical protein